MAAGSDEELLDGYLTAETEQRALDGRVARLAVELERRGTCDREFGLRTGSWPAADKDPPAGRCRYRVKVAVKLATHLPEVLDAVETGRLAWEHAEVIHEAANPRIIDLFADGDALIADVHGQVFSRWRLAVRRAAWQLDIDGGHDPDRHRPDRFHVSSGTTWTDGHHTVPWDHRGPTDLHLLGLLCRHHRVVHRTGWHMTPNGDGTFTITTHTGRTMQPNATDADNTGSATNPPDTHPTDNPEQHEAVRPTTPSRRMSVPATRPCALVGTLHAGLVAGSTLACGSPSPRSRRTCEPSSGRTSPG